MVDLSRVQERVETLAAKVDELVAKANSGGSDDGSQAQVAALESRLDEILARIP
jgi:hypothetical protein